MIFEEKILAVYKNMMYRRCDDNGTAFYFSHLDFPSLQQESYPFRSTMGHTLQGYLYHYDSPIPRRLVIFDHGFGGGHRSYMREIELLCRHGYLVLAYDHTGCMESGGDTPNGLAQSLCDLNDCLTTVKADPRFSGFDLSVIGHSWGGFSTMNIAAFHKEISHIVVLSGFVSVELLVRSFFSGLLSGYRKAVLNLEQTSNPRFSRCSGVDALSGTDARILLVYSDDDKLCRKTPHYDTLHTALKDRPHVRFLLVPGKNHNPNYTADAVKYLAEYAARRDKLIRKKLLETDEQKSTFVSSFDWQRMTAQDEAVWEEIFRTLDAE